MGNNKSTRFITSPRDGADGSFNDPITVVLLSDKVGHRMKSYGPTPLLSLGRDTILDYQLQAIKSRFSNYEIIICTGFDSEKVTRFIKEKYSRENIRVVENQMYYHTNTCESLRLCLNNNVSHRVLVCDGSILMDGPIFSIVKGKSSCIMTESTPSTSGSGFEVGVTVNDVGEVTNLCYGLDTKWSEVTFLSGQKVIESLRRIVSMPDYKTKFIFEALNELTRTTKYRLGSLLNDVCLVEKVNNIKTYHKVRKLYAGTYTKLRNQ